MVQRLKEKIRHKPLTRSEMMSRVRGSETTIEMVLRKILWQRGLRYRKNVKSIFGKPDVVFRKHKIAVFCDSEFWHGKYLKEGLYPKTRSAFWINKLKKNIESDKVVNKVLKKSGWTIMRFWQKEILKNPSACADRIEHAIRLKS